MKNIITPLLVIPLLFAITGCGERQLLNPGAETAYWLVPQADLDADHPRYLAFVGGESIAREVMTLGDCSRDASRIRVAHKMEDWIHQHEVCHLIDDLGGDAAAARAHLGAGCPACVYDLLDACDRYSAAHAELRKHWQWRVLQNMYPRDAVIHHDNILAELKRQDAEIFSLHLAK
jgi:hypothetical protein